MTVIPGLPSSVVTGVPRTVTGTDTATSTDHVLLLDATSAAFTETLPSAVGFQGVLFLKAITIGVNLVTVSPVSAQTIDGLTTITLGTGGGQATLAEAALASDGSNWRIV